MSVPSAFMTCSRNIELLPIVGHRLVLRTAFIEQDGLGGELAGGGEYDAAVRQIMRADVVAAVTLSLVSCVTVFAAGVVLIDLPIGLLGVGVL